MILRPLQLLLVVSVPAFSQQLAERVIDADCATVWKHVIPTFAKNGFDPKAADRMTGFATFSYRQGQQVARLTNQVNEFTNAGAHALSGYRRFGIENATFTAADDRGKCRTSAVFDFIGYKDNLFYKGWFKLGTNGVLEARTLRLLAEVVARNSIAQSPDENAIRPHVTENPTTRASVADGNLAKSPRIKFTSDPPGAEVLVDGEYLGSTPTVELEQKEGTRVIRIKKRGFVLWERKITLKAGDIRTVTVDLEAEPVDPTKPRIVGLDKNP